ncbi:hypothetical protein [Cohnella sp. GCM10012308]|uniref:DUF7507 domain-containing protein n=1 Tax=Cohnella sp. GCM10012308 TaxID=3317329 RepID=UPI00360EB890
MAFIFRFSANEMGSITFTGNTLGLSRSESSARPAPGTFGAIGAFTTIDTSSQYFTFPPGTTGDFNANRSSAVLRLPPGSSVLYAELVWGGTFANSGANLSAFINKPINFTTPDNFTFTVSQDPATAFQETILAPDQVYVRSADVTSIVQSQGAGTYTVGGVVGTINLEDIVATNCCGWTLCVAFQNPSLPFRNLSIDVGAVVIRQFSAGSRIIIGGFGTPLSGPLSGRLAIAALEGDADIPGEQVLFGPNSSSMTLLSGPNNFINNFFASQINDDNGLLDTSGTFGFRNQINGTPGSNVVGGRQGLDITNVDVSATLVQNQTQAELLFRTDQESYVPIAFGLIIDINAPQIEITKTVDTTQAILGKVLTYFVEISNTGSTNADVSFLDVLPSGTLFLPNSVFMNGIQLPDANPSAGILLGNVVSGTVIELTFQVKVISRPPDDVIVNNSQADFSFQAIADGPIIEGSVSSNEVVTPFLAAELNLVKTVFPESAAPGEPVFYTFLIENIGARVLTDIRIMDPLLGFEQTISSLDPGTSTSLFLDFIVPAGTPAKEVLRNTATATSNEADPVEATAQITVLPAYELKMIKRPDRFTVQPGEAVNFTLEVTNLSNAPLSNIIVSDSITGFTSVVPFMASLEVRSFEVPFTVPTGVPAGSILSNVATADSNETGPVSDTAEIVIGVLPQLTIFKSVNPSTAAPGQMVSYTITVVNEGNSLLTNVHLTDPFLRVDQTFDLNPGDSFRLLIPFAVPSTSAQGEVIRNIASVTSDQTAQAFANADLVVLGQSSLSLTKTASPSSAVPGSTITYTFRIENSGTTKLNNVVLSDPLLGVKERFGTLTPGEFRTIVFRFTIPLDAVASFVNTAIVSGDFGDFTVSATDDALVELLQPAFVLTKTVEPEQAPPGGTVIFSYAITNTGSIPLTNITLSDPMLGFAQTISVLAPGATESGTIPFVIPADTLAGTSFTNLFTAAPTEAEAQESSATVAVLAAPYISLVKTTNRATALPGEIVVFTITVANTGNQALTSVGVGDTLLSLDAILPTLNVGESQSFVIPFEIPAGTPSGTILSNISTATSDQTESVESVARVIVDADPLTINVTKTASKTTAAPGDTIQYTISATNPNEIALSNAVLSDELLGIIENLGTLLPGEIRTLNFIFEVPATMLAGTEIVNTTVIRSDQTNSAEATVLTSVIGVPAISLAKKFSPSEGRPGETVNVILTLRNIGNTDLTNIMLRDEAIGLEIAIPVLSSGSEQRLSFPFVIPNIQATTVITNTATVSTDQTGVSQASGELNVLARLRANFVKNVDRRIASPGETVTFTFLFQNLSNTALTNVRFEDSMLGIVQTAADLPPDILISASRTFTIPPGTPGGTILRNIAVIETAEIPRIESEESVKVADRPELELRKAVFPERAVPGQEVFYFLEGTNTGNVPLKNIHFSDPLLSFQGVVANQEPGVTLFIVLPFIVPPHAVPGERVMNTLFVQIPGRPLQTVSAVLSVIAPPLSILKESSAAEVFVSDTFRYTLKISNTGEITAREIVVTDLLQEGIKFVANSVMINGVPSPGLNPERGIALGNLLSDQTILLSFEVQAVFVPSTKKVNNLALASFLPGLSRQRQNISSNIVIVRVNEHEE